MIINEFLFSDINISSKTNDELLKIYRENSGIFIQRQDNIVIDYYNKNKSSFIENNNLVKETKTNKNESNLFIK
ncbi:MAG: hypothetical protein LBU68_01525 [Rickettsiales bacterium]|jgi:hypothetical protein|nr:hypothetical protein [Rickettsiales bacterium]